METLEKTLVDKVAINSLKNDIFNTVQEQKLLKNQRKTVNLKGERLIEPSEAVWRVYINSLKLRVMYAAYGLMRGKDFSYTENHYPEETHPLNNYLNSINKCIEVHMKKE
jgi:hypothetical protein